MTQAETTIRNRRGEFGRVVEAVDRVAVEHHLAPEVVMDMQVALDEVLANIVDYAYSDDAEHEIRIRLNIHGNVLEATIEDDGMPFNPLESTVADIHAPLRQRRIGGVGLHFVKNLMSEVRYNRVGDRNRLVLRKRLTD